MCTVCVLLCIISRQGDKMGMVMLVASDLYSVTQKR